MRRSCIFTAIIALLWVFTSCAKSAENDDRNPNPSASKNNIFVSWHNFNDGIKLAREKRKPVVIDFYADWCGWCKKMDAEVFSDSEVARKLRDDFICIRIYTDKNISEIIRYKNHTLTKQEFSTMLGVQGLPTLVFMDREANLITKIPGFIKKNVFLPLIGYMEEECYQKKVSFNDYMDGKSPCNRNKK
jgi:thioredoxin-related protein